MGRGRIAQNQVFGAAVPGRRTPLNADPLYSTEQRAGCAQGRRELKLAVSWGIAPEAEEAFMKFRIIVEPDEDGVFVATVPSLPGCVSQGGTREEALRNVREAIEGYVDSLRERNEPIPPSIHEEVIDVAV
jgi:antitoxin HicB